MDAIDAAHLSRQREWSRATFGPGRRTHGVTNHVRKELDEVEADPDGLGTVHSYTEHRDRDHGRGSHP